MNAAAEIKTETEITESEIMGLYSRAADLAARKVEQWARRLLREHPEMGEFRMANGGYAFYQARKPDDRVCLPGKIYTDRDIEREYLREFNDFIWRWDRELGLTDVAMRFTADGPKTTSW